MAKKSTIPPDGQGELAESLFNVAVSRGYIFRPAHLGDKWPTSDFYVELKNSKENFFFIVQVKSSSKTVGVRSKKLPIKVSSEKTNSLSEYYAPTYIAGVDMVTEDVYLIPVNNIQALGINSIETKFEINNSFKTHGTAILQLLYDDVRSFWINSNLMQYKNSFQHSI